MQVARCGGLTPAKAAIHAVTVMSSMPLGQCNRCTAVEFLEERHMSRARPSSRWPQQGKATQRAQRALNVIAAASAQAVPLEHLLEVAERAAKAGAAVSDKSSVPYSCNGIITSRVRADMPLHCCR